MQPSLPPLITNMPVPSRDPSPTSDEPDNHEQQTQARLKRRITELERELAAGSGAKRTNSYAFCLYGEKQCVSPSLDEVM